MEFEKGFNKFFLFVGEISGFIISFSVGIILLILRKQFYSLAKRLGFTSLEEANTKIRSIVNDCIELKGRMRCKTFAFIRCSNGKAYVTSTTNKVNITKLNSKPDDFVPNELEERHFRALIKYSIDYDWKFIKYENIRELDPNSPLLILLEEHKISTIYIHKISDRNEEDEHVYGFLIFGWVEQLSIDEFLDNFSIIEKRMLDSIHLRFISFIDNSIFEKIGIRKMT